MQMQSQGTGRNRKQQSREEGICRDEEGRRRPREDARAVMVIWLWPPKVAGSSLQVSLRESIRASEHRRARRRSQKVPSPLLGMAPNSIGNCTRLAVG